MDKALICKYKEKRGLGIVDLGLKIEPCSINGCEGFYVESWAFWCNVSLDKYGRDKSDLV